MVHRAMLGSVERMTAVLTEHWGGKWPFWLSPRQCIIVPIDLKFLDYCLEVIMEYIYFLLTLVHFPIYYYDVGPTINP